MTKEELQEALNAKLPLNATREQLHEHIRIKDRLVHFLATSLATVQRSVLELRDINIERTIDEQEPTLVGFEEPKIIGIKN